MALIAIIGEMGCHSEDTLAVTPSGFKKHTELRVGDEVYGIDKKFVMRKTKITKTFEYDYEGEMIHFFGGSYDFLVTPNHNMLFRNTWVNDFKFTPASLIASKKETGHFPCQFNSEGIVCEKMKIGDKEYDTNDLMRLCGLYVSEGSRHSSKSGKYMYFSIFQTKYFNEVKELLEKLNLNYGVYDNRRFIIFSLPLADFLFKNFGVYSEHKTISEEILELDKSHLIHLYEGMMAGDGSYNQRYYTTSKKLVEMFSILSLKLGFSPNYKERPLGKEHLLKGHLIKPNFHGNEIGISFNPRSYLSTSCDKRRGNYKNCDVENNYNGKVWCFETELGNFFTTRKGKISVSGNSGKTLAMTYLALRKYMKGEDIYANYHIRFPAYPNGKSPTIMLVKTVQDIIRMKNGYAILDELWSSMDSRMSGTKKNKFVTTILLKSRKRGINIAFTTQSFHQMDKRIRDVTDFLAIPSLTRNETICHLNIYTLPEERLLKSYKFPTPPLWKTYDTNEEIEPLIDDSELKAEPPAEDNLPEEITMEEKIKDAFTDDD